MKIYAYIAAALLVMGLIASGLHIYNRAQAYKALKVEHEALGKAFEKYTADTQAAIAQAELRSATLAAAKDTTQAELDTLRSTPPKTMVKHVQLPGEPCPSLRLDPEFVRDWNTISEAAALPDPR